MTLASFAHHLPYWAVLDVFDAGSVAPSSVLVLVDGTVVTGFSCSGVDVFSADNGTLNRNALALRRALNALPPDFFLQAEWHTGLSYRNMIEGYERHGDRDPLRHLLLVEQRRWRAAMLRGDQALVRGRLVFFVGSKRALPSMQMARAARRSATLRAALFGARPTIVSRAEVDQAAKSVLETAARVASELAMVGARVTPLSGEAVLSEAHRVLNPRTAKKVPLLLRALGDGAALSTFARARPTRSRAAGDTGNGYEVLRGLSLREQLPLGDLSWADDGFVLDDPPVRARALSLQRLPALTRPDFLMGVQFAASSPLRVVSTFVATDSEQLQERLTRKRNIAHAQAHGVVRNIAADVAQAEYEEVLERLLTDDQRVFQASVQVVVHARSDKALDLVTREVKEAFSNQGAVLSTETGRQLLSYLGTLPGYGYQAPLSHALVTNNAADFVPTFVPSEGDREPAMLYHTRQQTLRRFSLSPSSSRPNNNALVLGTSGSGKSFNLACIFQQACLYDGAPLFVLDVQGPELSSYKVLAELLGGTYVALGAQASGTRSAQAAASVEGPSFSPFPDYIDVVSIDAAGQPAFDEDALRFLSTLVALMAFPELSSRRERPYALEIARIAILRAYRETGPMAAAPILSDVVSALSSYQAEHEEHQVVAREMFLQLRAWVQDSARARLLNRRRRAHERSAPDGPLAASARPTFQVFDFFGMERDQELATILLLTVSFRIWRSLRHYPRDKQKLVVLDECWKLLSSEAASDLVSELFRTGRKWGASTFAVTQNLSDFVASPAHQAILSNASLLFLMQHATGHTDVASLCALNHREDALFRQLTLKKGAFSEMLLVDRAVGRASVLRLVPTAFDLWLNTTDPVDCGFRARVMKERGLTMLEAIRFCAERYPKGAPTEREARDDSQGAIGDRRSPHGEEPNASRIEGRADRCAKRDPDALFDDGSSSSQRRT